MASTNETGHVKDCDECGASILQEHLDHARAGMWAGKMLCPACLKDKREQDVATGTESQDSQVERGFGMPWSGMPTTTDEPPQAGARHIRTFHAKLVEGAIRHLDEQVNTWLDNNPEIHLKFAHTTIGMWEGKHTEQSLILTVFY